MDWREGEGQSQRDKDESKSVRVRWIRGEPRIECAFKLLVESSSPAAIPAVPSFQHAGWCNLSSRPKKHIQKHAI